MKKFTVLTALLFVALLSFAQKGIATKTVEPHRFIPQLQVNKTLSAGIMNRTQQATQRVKAPKKAEQELVALPDGVTSSSWAVTEVYWRVGSSSYSPASLNVAIDGNDIYIQGLAYWFSDAWVKGTISGNKAIFPSGQYVGEDEYGEEYIVGFPGSGETLEDIEFEWDADTQTLNLQNYILENDNTEELYYYAYIGTLVLSGSVEVEQPDLTLVTPPDDLETSDYYFVATNYFSEEEVVIPVKVGFYGNEVYIQGIATNDGLPDAWIKGTNGDVITLDYPQYLGDSNGSHIFFAGLDFSAGAFEEGKLTIEGDKIVANNALTTTSSIDDFTSFWSIFTDGEFVTEVLPTEPAVPSKPEILGLANGSFGPYMDFAVYATDVDGNNLKPQLLSYRLVYDVEGDINTYVLEPGAFTELEEALSEIPYKFTDNWDIYVEGDIREIYLNTDIDGWSRVGVQSIYTVDDVTNESEIAWYDINAITPVAGIELDGKKLATYYNSNDDVTLAEGTEIFTATLAEDGLSVKLVAAEGNVIPADNAVVLKTTNDVIYYTRAAATEVVLNEDNALVGTDLAFNVEPGEFWVLGQIEGVAGFYEFVGDYIGANKAYLLAEDVIAAQGGTTEPIAYGKGLPFVGGTATAINSVNTAAATQAEAVFNLAGQRVNNQYKGVVIVNGKKAIRK